MNKELLDVTTQQPQINANFIELRDHLHRELEAFDFVVTSDNVKSSKAKAAELNKLKAEIDSRRKQVVAEISAPIRQFEAEAKELVSMCEDARQKIVQQVKRFEAEVIETCEELLIQERDEHWDHHNIREEFRTWSPKGQGKLSWVTAKGRLTAAAVNHIRELVAKDLAWQSEIDSRLARLAGVSEAVGLSTPIEPDDIAEFLHERDTVKFDDFLTRFAKRAKERENAIAEKAREEDERIRAEQRAAMEAKTAHTPPPEKPPADPSARYESTPVMPAPETYERELVVQVTLKIGTPGTMSNQSVIKAIRDRLAKGGIEKSVSCIEIVNA